MEFLYRVVYRVKPSEWDTWRDPAENVWRPNATQTGFRPYTQESVAKSIATRENNKYSRSKYEYRVQRLPADGWEFI